MLISLFPVKGTWIGKYPHHTSR